MLLLALLLQTPFEAGARDLLREVTGPSLDVSRYRLFERRARAGQERFFARDAGDWFPYVLHGLVIDDERVATASLKALREICARHGITDESGANPARLDRLGAADRAELFKLCLAWYYQNKEGVAKGRRLVRWNELIRDLRSGGAWTDTTRPEGLAFRAVKELGAAAWPVLADYAGHDDLLTAKTATRALNTLTGRDTPLPTEATRDGLQAEWRGWLRGQGLPLAPEPPDFLAFLADDSSEEEVGATLRRLESGDIEARGAAARALRAKAFRHEDRLRRALDTADGPEIRVAIGPILDELPDLKQAALELRGDGVWLRASIARLRREAPDAAAFGRRVERLLRSLDDLWTEMRDIEHRRALIAKACGFDLPGRARWSEARDAWEIFAMDVDPAGELNAAVALEMEAINRAAVKDVEDLRREALRRFEKEGAAAVRAWLPGEGKRFEGTEAEPRFDEIRNVLASP